jgi:hypothetical protein
VKGPQVSRKQMDISAENVVGRKGLATKLSLIEDSTAQWFLLCSVWDKSLVWISIGYSTLFSIRIGKHDIHIHAISLVFPRLHLL